MPAMRDFFQRRGKFRPEKADEERTDLQIPEDLWIKCPRCGELIYSRELERNDQVCPKCTYHFRLRARERIGQLTDPGSFVELARRHPAGRPAWLRRRRWPLRSEARADPEQERRVGGARRRAATIDGLPVTLAVSDFEFLGASMGSVYGEKLVRAVEGLPSTRLRC